MKKILKLFDESKTLQILLEKFLIALLIMLATYCINRNLEAFKTRNTIAEVSISKFINSTNDIWKKIDEFEDLTSELCSDAFIYILKEKKNDKYSFQYESEYAVKFKQYTTLKKELFNLISKNEFIIGAEVAHQFYIYLEFLEMQMDLKLDYCFIENCSNREKSLSDENAFRNEKNKYRFDVYAAQEYAIKRFLK